MAPQFEPMKNDLILRTARGKLHIKSIWQQHRILKFGRRESRACTHVGDASRLEAIHNCLGALEMLKPV